MNYSMAPEASDFPAPGECSIGQTAVVRETRDLPPGDAWHESSPSTRISWSDMTKGRLPLFQHQKHLEFFTLRLYLLNLLPLMLHECTFHGGHRKACGLRKSFRDSCMTCGHQRRHQQTLTFWFFFFRVPCPKFTERKNCMDISNLGSSDDKQLISSDDRTSWPCVSHGVVISWNIPSVFFSRESITLWLDLTYFTFWHGTQRRNGRNSDLITWNKSKKFR